MKTTKFSRRARGAFWFCFVSGLALTAPSQAHADLMSDIARPLELAQQEKFAEALPLLDKLAARYPNEFLVHYLRAAAQLGTLDSKATPATNIAILRKARASIARSRELSEGDKNRLQQVKEMEDMIAEGLQALGAPLDEAATPPDKDDELAQLKARIAELEAQKNAPATKPVAPVALAEAKLPPLAPKPGFIIGRCVNMRGKPLTGVEIYVSGTTLKGGEKTSYTTKTDANGKYAIQLPLGNFALGRANYPTAAPSGPPYGLPLHPLTANRDEQSSARGIVTDCVLKINGHISPKKDADSDLSYYGGFITVEGGPLEKGNFLDGYNYKFPAGSSVELVLVPQGALADGSTGQTLRLRRPIARGYSAEFIDVPIGAYQATARLIDANGQSLPLRIAAAKFFSGTSPTAKPVEATDFGTSARVYFPSRGDSIPVLTYGGAAKAPIYVQP